MRNEKKNNKNHRTSGIVTAMQRRHGGKNTCHKNKGKLRNFEFWKNELQEMQEKPQDPQVPIFVIPEVKILYIVSRPDYFLEMEIIQMVNIAINRWLYGCNGM